MSGPLYYDRVKETTTTTGTGTLTLAGAAVGFRAFSTVGDGNTCYYCVSSSGGSEWEVGLGTYTLSGTTLARTTVLASSNSGSAVSFSAGSKDVFLTNPATGITARLLNSNNLSDVSSKLTSGKNLSATINMGSSGVAVSHTGDTVKTLLGTVTIPQNAFPAGAVMIINAIWSWTSSANNKEPEILLGGSSGTDYYDITTATGIQTFRQVIIFARTAATQVGANSGATGGGGGPSGGALITSSKDFTAGSVDVAFTGKLSNSGETITLESYSVLIGYP